MAEAHGQLTGPPGRVPRDARRRRRQPRDRHPHGPPGLEPDVRPGRAGRAGAISGARPSRRSTRSPRSAGSPSGRPSRMTAEDVPGRAGGGRPRGPRRAARTGPPRRCRRTCSTRSSTCRRPRPHRPAPARPTPEAIRGVIELLASAERPVILAGGGVLRARTSTELLRFAELLHVPVIAGLAARRRHLERPSALPRHGRATGPRRRSGTRLETADAMLVIGCRLNEPTSYGYAIPAAGHAAGRTSTSSRPAAPAWRPPTPVVEADARSFLRAANERLLGGAVLDAERVADPRRAQRRGPRDVGGRDRRRRDAVGRAGRPPGPDDRDAAARAPRRGDRDHRCRQLRRLGRPRLPVPPPRDVPRSDLGGDGLRRCRRPSRPRSSIATARSWRSSATAGWR